MDAHPALATQLQFDDRKEQRMEILCPAEAGLSWRQTTGSQTLQAGRIFGVGSTLSRALMTSTRTRKGGAAATIWHTYCTAAAPLAAPREMSAANPDPAKHSSIHSIHPSCHSFVRPSVRSHIQAAAYVMMHGLEHFVLTSCVILFVLCWPYETSG